MLITELGYRTSGTTGARGFNVPLTFLVAFSGYFRPVPRLILVSFAPSGMLLGFGRRMWLALVYSSLRPNLWRRASYRC